jgi:hypothetical protein
MIYNLWKLLPQFKKDYIIVFEDYCSLRYDPI